MSKVVVVGGLGNYGLVIAGLISARHEVTVLHFPEVIYIPGIPGALQRSGTDCLGLLEELNRNGTVYLDFEDHTETFKVHRASADTRVVTDADIIVITYPSLFHSYLGQKLKPYLHDQAIVTFTDRFLGGFHLLHQAGHPSKPLLIGVSATPVTAYRTYEPFRRRIYTNKANITIGVFPGYRREEGTRVLQDLLPGNFSTWNSILELAFDCTPSNLHAVQDLFNIVRYELGEHFSLFRSGFTFGIERIISAVSCERESIARAYGVRSRSFLEYERQTYETLEFEIDTITHNRTCNPSLAAVSAPTSIWKCKGIEDVACALFALKDFGDDVEVPLPTISALIQLWEVYLGINFAAFARTKAQLGLQGLSPESLRVLMENGF